jgi:hypothetical protein
VERLTADIKATLNGPMSQKEVTPNTGSAPAATWPNSAFLQNRRYAPRLLHFALNGGWVLVRKVLVPLTVGMLALLCTACGSSSATTATGNKSTCDDFFAYGTFIQSLKGRPSQTAVHDQLQRLEEHLMVDGPTARSSALAETANREVAAIKAQNGNAIAEQLNASTSDCSLLGHFPPGSSATGQG